MFLREFYLGNDNLHALTQTNRELKIELQTYSGNEVHANYHTFHVEGETEDYRLSIGGYTGNIIIVTL